MRAVERGADSVRARNNNTAMTPANRACVALIRAAFNRCRAKCIEHTTEAPTPNINPMPTITIVGAMQMLTAARPSLPVLCPTKMPSIAVTAHSDSIPISVGKKYKRKSRETLTVPKSIWSRCITL